MVLQCCFTDAIEEERVFLDAITIGRSSHKRFLIASSCSHWTMKSVAVLLLISLISALFICCALVDTAHSRGNENPLVLKRNLDVDDDMSIIVYANENPPEVKKNQDVNDDYSVNVNGENTTPIIGILSLEAKGWIERKYPNKTLLSYIAASYVKFVEGAGGRVMPISIGKPREYYEEVLSKVNGVLIPGGATFFNESLGYADAGRHIYNIAVDLNQRGTYMPIWGICLGFQLLVYISANNTELRTDCASSSQALNLEFKEGFRNSRMFVNASDDVIEILEKYPVTANFHRFCFTEKTFAENKMNELWNVLSLNHDWNGEEFISSIEHKKYPFYGVQFHPEKNLYEFIANRNITHISKAIITSQYFARFFIDESRKNYNHFSNKTEEIYSLIYNYNPEYSGAVGSAFVQLYLFENDQVQQERKQAHQVEQDLMGSKNCASRSGLLLLLLIKATCLSTLGSWRQLLLI